MSMSEMDQGAPGGKEDNIEEVIELNQHGLKFEVSLQLHLASDSNNHAIREVEQWNRTSENTNDNNFSGGHGQGEKRDVHLMGSNFQDDSVPRSKIPRLTVPSLATCSNNDRAHPVGASVCTISQLQEHKDWPIFSAVTAEHENYKKASAPMVSKDTELKVTSDVDELNQDDDKQHSFILGDSRYNKYKKLIRAVRYGTNDELKNPPDLCQNNISFQLLHEILESSLIQEVRRGQEVKVQQLVDSGAFPANNFKDKDGYTALLVAAENGFTDIARFLLEKGANVNAINNNMDSALILSVTSSKSTELVKLLLSHNANLNLENKYGFTALMKALETRDFDTCKLLVDAGADVNRNSRGGTALMQLVKSECGVKICSTTLKIMKLLLQNGAHTCSDTAWELNVLCVATRAGKTEMVRLLCEHGVEVNEICNNQTALMIAAELGHLKILEILLDEGANVNIQNDLGLNSLLIALKFGQVDCAKFLLSREPHLDLPTAVKLTVEKKQSSSFQFLACQYKIDASNNLLNLAVEMGMEDFVRILINMGTGVNKGASNGRTPLEIALRSQHGLSLINCLIQNGACVNGIGVFVPLHWAMVYSVEITKLLLDSGADVNEREIFLKDTALIEACDKNLDLEIVKLLLANGAHINLQNISGCTALHVAALQANVDLVKLLVESGADIEIKAHNNKTAYLYAARECNIEVFETLQKHGANTCAVDYSGCNALMLAIQFARFKCKETSALLYLVGNGSQINHQCNKGYTALMMAAEAQELELIKRLPYLGADVNITASVSPGRNITALSILLENFQNCSFENSSMDCIEVLIKHGAVNSLPEGCNGVLHELIMMDKRRMIQLLLTNGMAPTISSLKLHKKMPHYFDRIPVLQSTELSLLTVALVCGNIQVAEYLIGNWALCPCDLNYLSQKELRDFLVANHKSKNVEFIDTLLCQPASLLQLSFITVSHALGGVPGREDRINSLPLPQVIKKKLMFHEEVVQMDFTKNVSVVNLDDYDSDTEYFF